MKENPDFQTSEINYLKTPEWQEEMGLKDVLVASVFSPTVSLDRRVNRIRLGQLGDEAKTLLHESYLDDLERCYEVYVTPQRKVLVTKNYAKGKVMENGQGTLINLKIELDPLGFLVPREKRQSRYLATLMHSHGKFNLPQSPADLISLLNIVESPGVAPLSYVITPSCSWLIFRGENSPQWFWAKINDKVNLWQRAEIDRTARLWPSNQWIYKDVIHFNAHVQGTMLSQIAREYDLQIFFSPAGSDMAERKPPTFIRDYYRP